MFNHKDSELLLSETNSEEIKNTEGIQLSVLNSTSISGIADKTRTYLRNNSFDVLEIGNYSEHLKKSVIYDRVGDRTASLKIAAAIGIADSLIILKKDSTLFLKATLILGDDYKTLVPFR